VGMYYFYQRWYDPQTATFASIDPQFSYSQRLPELLPNPAVQQKLGRSEGTDLMYTLASNRPTSIVDPDGEKVLGILVGLGIGGTVALIAINSGLDTRSQTAASLGCTNNAVGTAGFGAIPRYNPIPGAPPLCLTALCRANQERNGPNPGLAQSYIDFWNEHCAGPTGRVGSARGWLGKRTPGIKRAWLCTPWGCL
jgi:hypothetical protein